MNILVTGAFGFLGRYVARFYAQSGHIVYGIGHGSWTKAEAKQWGLSDWRTSDITLSELQNNSRKPDTIVHCAGSGSVGFSISHPKLDFDRTVETTRAVLEYARLNCPEARIILPSSASVYGDTDARPISKITPLAPISPYGLHKKLAEELCCSYAQNFGTSIAIVRLFSIYGIGLRKQLLWDACRKLAIGPAIFGGTGTEKRDWLHVDDAARLILATGQEMLLSPFIINGGTGIGTPISRNIEVIANAFGGPSHVQFSGISRPGDPSYLVADNTENQELNWQPERNLEVELTRYIDWFKAGAL